MAQKRPSFVSIRRRQRNIIEGMGTRDLKFGETAKQFGVTPHDLEHFLTTRPKTLRKSFNRNPANVRLWQTGDRKEVRKALGVSRIRVYEHDETEITSRARKLTDADLQIGRMIQRVYIKNNEDAQQWSIYTREHDLPNSILHLRLLYHNGRITRAEYRAALRAWKAKYGVSDDYYNDFVGEDFDSEEDDED